MLPHLLKPQFIFASGFHIRQRTIQQKGKIFASQLRQLYSLEGLSKPDNNTTAVALHSNVDKLSSEALDQKSNLEIGRNKWCFVENRYPITVLNLNSTLFAVGRNKHCGIGWQNSARRTIHNSSKCQASIWLGERNEEGKEYPVASNLEREKKNKMRPQYSVETTMRYMKSQVYKETYQGEPIYHWYRRNIRGQASWQGPPRKFCVNPLTGRFIIGNPCPICRDEYLQFDYRLVDLLKMFIQDGTELAMPILRTGLCMEQYTSLRAAILKAQRYGTLTFEVPFRNYNYKEYYPDWQGEALPPAPPLPVPLPESKKKTFTVYSEHNVDQKQAAYVWWTKWDKFAHKFDEGGPRKLRRKTPYY